jgi:putative hemolysin
MFFAIGKMCVCVLKKGKTPEEKEYRNPRKVSEGCM